MFVLVYVDDIIVASSSSQATEALLQDLKRDFSLKDLGNLHYFLGIEVKHVPDGLVLSQERYAADVLSRSGMDKAKAVDRPLSSTEKLSLTAGDSLSSADSTRYRSVVGLCSTSLLPGLISRLPSTKYVNIFMLRPQCIGVLSREFCGM
jgi:histone deacetylase 1/2